MSENHSIRRPRPPSDSSQSNLSDISQHQPIVADQLRIKLSKRRWLILFAVAVLGFTSALCGELSPILSTMLKLLDLDVHQYVYVSQISYYLLLIVAMPFAWFVDRFGIRKSMYFITLIMLIRNSLRALMFFPESPGWKHLKLFYYISSSVTGLMAYAMFFCLPLKISELWFATSERSIAWTVMISTLDLGVSLAAFTFPRYIHDDLINIKLLAYINIGSSLVSAPIVLLCVTKSKPKHPASERMLKATPSTTPYLGTLKNMVCHKDIVAHIMHAALYQGFNLSVTGLLQDLFAETGKTKVFVGDLIAYNALLQIVILIASSTVVHRSSNPTLTCKLAAVAQTVTLFMFIASMEYPMSNWIVMVISFSFTMSKSWFTPNSANMMAHLATGNVSQATITAFAMTITLISGIIVQTIFVSLAIKLDDDKRDYTYSYIFTFIVCLINILFYLIFFEGKSSKSEDEPDQTAESGQVQS